MSGFKYRPLACVGFTAIAVMLLIILSGHIFAGGAAAFALGAVLLVSAAVSKKIRRYTVLVYTAAALIFSGLALCAEYTYSYEKAVSAVCENAVIQGELTGECESSDAGVYYVLKNVSVNSVELSSKLRLSSSSPIEAYAGDTVSFTADVRSVDDFHSSLKNYYISKRIYLTTYVKDAENVSVIKSGEDTLTQKLQLIRDEIKIRIYSLLPNEYGGVIIAMLTGDKNGISDELSDAFSDSGISHLFAVSGLHLSVWALGFYTLLEKIGIRRRLNAAFAILFTLCFMALSGFSPSVMRAGLMLIIMLSGSFFERIQDSLNSLGAAVFIILILNPMQAVDISLLLSFSATLGIITMSESLYRPIGLKLGTVRPKALKNVLKASASVFSVSLCAGIAVLPVSAFVFDRISLVSPLTNVLVSYPATAAMISGGISAVLFPLGGFAVPFAFTAGLIAKYIVAVAKFFASLPFSSVGTSSVYFKVGFILCVTLAVCTLIFVKDSKKRIKAICAALSAVCICLGAVFIVYNHSMTKITVAPVGDGTAVAVKNGSHSILLGCGGSNYDSSYAVLEAINRDKADMLVVPNNNRWNSSCAVDLIKAVEFDRIVVGEKISEVLSLREDSLVSQKFCLNPWENASIEFVQTELSSYAYCIFGGTDVLIVFDCEKASDIPKKCLDADILICSYYLPDGIDYSRFGNVVISSGDRVCEDITDSIIGENRCVYSTYGGRSVGFEIRDKGSVTMYYN